MKPESAMHPGFTFTVNDQQCFIGLFSIFNPDHPDVAYAALLQFKNGVWVEVDRHDTYWKDIKGDITPGNMAELAITKFNKTLETIGGGIAMTWNQKLAAIFQLQLAVENNQLVIKK